MACLDGDLPCPSSCQSYISDVKRGQNVEGNAEAGHM